MEITEIVPIAGMQIPESSRFVLG